MDLRQLITFQLNRVSGDSMSPVLRSGDYVLFRPVWNKQHIRIGSVVKVCHPIYGKIIKRVMSKEEGVGYRLVGENSQSVTSEAMGIVPFIAIEGVMCWHISP